MLKKWDALSYCITPFSLLSTPPQLPHATQTALPTTLYVTHPFAAFPLLLFVNLIHLLTLFQLQQLSSSCFYHTAKDFSLSPILFPLCHLCRINFTCKYLTVISTLKFTSLYMFCLPQTSPTFHTTWLKAH